MIPRNGRCSFAHAGPCSVILALGEKYLSKVSEGGAPAMKDLQKPSAVDRMRSALFLRLLPSGILDLD